jgi:hypothetical protein
MYLSAHQQKDENQPQRADFSQLATRHFHRDRSLRSSYGQMNFGEKCKLVPIPVLCVETVCENGIMRMGCSQRKGQ